MRQLAPLALIAALAPVGARAAGLDLPLNQSAVVALSAPAHNVIIGNPAIANVNVADRRHLIVTAKGPGVTNLMVTDADGRMILQEEVVVGASGGDRVTLIAGTETRTYACAPRCQVVEGGADSPAAGPGGLFGSLMSLGAGMAAGPKPGSGP